MCVGKRTGGRKEQGGQRDRLRAREERGMGAGGQTGEIRKRGVNGGNRKGVR